MVKPELIGGARITVGDTVIDGTVQEQLRAMASSCGRETQSPLIVTPRNRPRQL